MIKNRAIEVIQTFSAEELKSFELFVRSPYNNSNKSLIRLLKLMEKYKDRTEEEKVTEEFLYSKIFPGKKYSYGNMKNMVSDLFGLCEKFLSHTPLINKSSYEFEEGLIRLENYSVRMLDKLFWSEYKRLEEKLKYSVLSNDYYLNKSRLIEKLHKFYTYRSQYSVVMNTLYPMSVYNICHMISTLQIDIAGMEFLRTQVNYVPAVNITEAFYTAFDNEKFSQNIIDLEPEHYEHISFRIKLIKVYTEPDNWENYALLKETIVANITKYANSERWHLTSTLYNFALNHYIAKSTIELAKELAQIRKLQIEFVKFNTEGLGPLQAGVFRNMVEVLLITGEIDYAERFINNSINQLEEDKRKNMYSYTMATIEQMRGNYERVLELVRDAEMSDSHEKYSVNMIKMSAFYDLGYIEEGLLAVDAMKHFLRNNEEFSDAAKHNLEDRVKVLERLFKIKANPEKYTGHDIEKLIAGINEFIVSRKEWYMQKAEELRKMVEG